MNVVATSAPPSAKPALGTADGVAVMVATLAAVFLVPWTIYLGGTLHHPGFWVAIDSLEALTAATTAVLVVRGSLWAPMVARIGGIVLVLDAYTDITSADRVGRLAEAVAMAVLVELPLAVAAWAWASRRDGVGRLGAVIAGSAEDGVGHPGPGEDGGADGEHERADAGGGSVPVDLGQNGGPDADGEDDERTDAELPAQLDDLRARCDVRDRGRHAPGAPWRRQRRLREKEGAQAQRVRQGPRPAPTRDVATTRRAADPDGPRRRHAREREQQTGEADKQGELSRIQPRVVRGDEPQDVDDRARRLDQDEQVDQEDRERTESPIEISATPAMPAPGHGSTV